MIGSPAICWASQSIKEPMLSGQISSHGHIFIEDTKEFIEKASLSNRIACPPNRLDYRLTTILHENSKADLFSVFKGFHKIQRSWMLFAENHTTVENTVFYQDAPENSDSVGRTFESCRAYHKNTHPTGVGIFIARYGSKFMPQRGKSCRAYQKFSKII